jgi:hypothetical protein
VGAMVGLSLKGCVLPNAHEAVPGPKRIPRTFFGTRR